jgi:hypothetical protein
VRPDCKFGYHIRYPGVRGATEESEGTVDLVLVFDLPCLAVDGVIYVVCRRVCRDMCKGRKLGSGGTMFICRCWRLLPV